MITSHLKMRAKPPPKNVSQTIIIISWINQSIINCIIVYMLNNHVGKELACWMSIELCYMVGNFPHRVSQPSSLYHHHTYMHKGGLPIHKGMEIEVYKGNFWGTVVVQQRVPCFLQASQLSQKPAKTCLFHLEFVMMSVLVQDSSKMSYLLCSYRV